jgi:hypothetical protein
MERFLDMGGKSLKSDAFNSAIRLDVATYRPSRTITDLMRGNKLPGK